MEFCGSCGHFKPWKRVRLTCGDGKCLAKNKITVVGSNCYDVFPGETAVDQYVPRFDESTEDS